MSKTIGVVLSLKDKCSETVKKVGEKLGLAANEAGRLDRTTKKVSKALKEDFNTACKIGAASIASATAGVVALVIKSNEAADRIDDMSNKIGISRKGFQEWDYILGQNGAHIESLQMGFKTLTNQITGANSGNKNAAKIFKDLGINIKNSSGQLKNQEEIFNEVVIALQKMPEGAKKAKYANDLLGRSGSELMPLFNATNEQLKRQREEYRRLGIEISDEAIDAGNKFGDAMEKLKSVSTGVVTILGGELLPCATELINTVISNAPKIKETLTPVMQGVSSAVKFAAADFKELTTAIIGITASIAALKICGQITATIQALGASVKGVTVLTWMWKMAVDGVNLAFKANPVGIVISAIGILVSLMPLVIKHWDGIVAGIKKAGNAVMDFIKIIPGIGQVVKLAESGAKAFGDWKNGKNGPAYNAQVKEPVKKYATGTTFTSGGLSLVGENGPELINLKKGASVISTDKTKELINSSDKNITINLNVNGNVIGNRDFIEEILRLLAIEFRKVMPA